MGKGKIIQGNVPTFFPTKSEKIIQRVEIAHISKENLEIEKISKQEKINNEKIKK
jgi:hypothetical protein